MFYDPMLSCNLIDSVVQPVVWRFAGRDCKSGLVIGSFAQGFRDKTVGSHSDVIVVD